MRKLGKFDSNILRQLGATANFEEGLENSVEHRNHIELLKSILKDGSL